MRKVSSDIDGFDYITEGGVPLSQCIGLISHYDVGKKFLMWLTWNFLIKKHDVLYICLNSSLNELIDNFSSANLNIKKFRDSKQLTIIDVFSASAKKLISIEKKNKIADEDINKYHTSMFDVNTICDQVKTFLSNNNSIKMCVIDSLSPLLLTKTQGVFTMIENIKRNVSNNKAIGITMIHSGIHKNEIEEKFKAQFEIIMFIQKTSGNSHYIKLIKYPGIPQKGPFPLEFGTQNFSIIPIEMPELDVNKRY